MTPGDVDLPICDLDLAPGDLFLLKAGVDLALGDVDGTPGYRFFLRVSLSRKRGDVDLMAGDVGVRSGDLDLMLGDVDLSFGDLDLWAGDSGGVGDLGNKGGGDVKLLQVGRRAGPRGPRGRCR